MRPRRGTDSVLRLSFPPPPGTGPQPSGPYPSDPYPPHQPAPGQPPATGGTTRVVLLVVAAVLILLGLCCAGMGVTRLDEISYYLDWNPARAWGLITYSLRCPAVFLGAGALALVLGLRRR